MKNKQNVDNMEQNELVDGRKFQEVSHVYEDLLKTWNTADSCHGCWKVNETNKLYIELDTIKALFCQQ